MAKSSPVFIIGHKNPDLDSVASALAYRDLKIREGKDQMIAAVPGDINKETAFVLNKLGLEPPKLVQDVRTRVIDLLDEFGEGAIAPNTPLRLIAQMIREKEQKTLAVVDQQKRLLGVVTIGDVAMTLMERLQQVEEKEILGSTVKEILSTRVAEIMKQDNLVILEAHETVQEAKTQMLRTRYRNYPVIDEDNRYLGMVSRHHLLSMKRKKVILVDHNEKKQAVDGIEEAELLEIIDHHRVGDLETLDPIYFRNEPVGATSTLIAMMYKEGGTFPTPEMSALLMAGILSDTMMLKSPTTTPKDLAVIEWLEEISGWKKDKWGKEIFAASVPLDLDDLEKLVTEDLKEYSFGDVLFAVGQIETADLGLFADKMGELRRIMQVISRKRAYDLMFLMITDIFIGGTCLLIEGEMAAIGLEAFGGEPAKDLFLPGVMSRKKQVVPAVFKALARRGLTW